MIVTFNRSLISGVYQTIVTTNQFSVQETFAINSFGEPLVDVGGAFPDPTIVTSTPISTPIVPLFERSQQMMRVVTDFSSGFTIEFSTELYGDQAEPFILLWEETMRQRFHIAMAPIETEQDTFSSLQDQYDTTTTP